MHMLRLRRSIVIAVFALITPFGINAANATTGSALTDCLEAYGEVSYDYAVASDAPPGIQSSNHAQAYKTAGSDAGQPGCMDSTQAMTMRASTLNGPNATISVRLQFGPVDSATANQCSGAVLDPDDAVLQSVPLDAIPNSDGTTSSMYGKVPANAKVLATLAVGQVTTVHMAMSCSYDADQSGSWDLAPTVTVEPDPYSQFPGVSIDAGAQATNTPAVSLNLSWNGLVDKVAISNDGGFAPSATEIRSLTSNPLPWKLASSGTERLPKTVYVRFHELNGQWDTTSFTDDIILDETPPKIDSATVGPSRAAAGLSFPWERASAPKGRWLHVKAHDNRTGVHELRYNHKKSSAGAKTVRYRKRLRVPSWRRTWVRVRDGAGNWSHWRLAN